MTERIDINGADVTILNAARGILRRIEDSATITYADGRCAEAARNARMAVSEAMIVARTYGDAPISDVDLHGKPNAPSTATPTEVPS